MLMDLHTHTALCQHAVGEPLDYVCAAATQKISILGCADHAPTPYGYDIYRMKREEWSLYLESVAAAREEGKRLNVEVLLGIEADWMHKDNAETLDLIRHNDLDYVIGSVHYVKDLAFDDPLNLSFWRDPKVADQIWSDYIQQILAMVKANVPNIIGHIDLPKKFGYYPSEKVMRTVYDGFETVFSMLARQKIAIEINTSGWRKPIAEQYPSETLLQMAQRAGVILTLGSDSHAPDEVGHRFKDAVLLARRLGFKQLAYFKKRERILVDLDDAL